MRKTKKYHKKGGNVIGVGNYSCVFYPALKCKGSKTKNREENKI